jgi:hypothetical protein
MRNGQCFNRKHAQCPWVVSRPTRVWSTRYLPWRVRICDLTTRFTNGESDLADARSRARQSACRGTNLTCATTLPPRRSPHVDCLRDSRVRSTREGQSPPDYVARSNGLRLLARDEFSPLDLAKRRLERGERNRIAGDAESTCLTRKSAYKLCSTRLCSRPSPPVTNQPCIRPVRQEQDGKVIRSPTTF